MLSAGAKLFGERRQVGHAHTDVGAIDLGDLDSLVALGGAEQVVVIGHDVRAARGAQGDGREEGVSETAHVRDLSPNTPELFTRIASTS